MRLDCQMENSARSSNLISSILHPPALTRPHSALNSHHTSHFTLEVQLIFRTASYAIQKRSHVRRTPASHTRGNRESQANGGTTTYGLTPLRDRSPTPSPRRGHPAPQRANALPICTGGSVTRTYASALALRSICCAGSKRLRPRRKRLASIKNPPIPASRRSILDRMRSSVQQMTSSISLPIFVPP